MNLQSYFGSQSGLGSALAVEVGEFLAHLVQEPLVLNLLVKWKKVNCVVFNLVSYNLKG